MILAYMNYGKKTKLLARIFLKYHDNSDKAKYQIIMPLYLPKCLYIPSGIYANTSVYILGVHN